MGVTSAFDIKPPSTKMKMFKKVKKRLGLGRGMSSANNATNNLPPLLFHRVHGENIRISRDGTVARRSESFCRGICFSARPVKIAEKICLRIADVSDSWSGVVRFGFTSNDPSGLQYNLPKYACPDLTNKPGYWAKALAERMCERDATLFYYLTAAGDVHFGVNGEEKGIFFSGVETRGQLWAMIDIYGNTTAIELLDPREQLNNSRRHGSAEDPMRFIVPQMANLSVQSAPQVSSEVPSHTCVVEPTPPPLRYQNPSTKFTPLPFHRTRGRNVRLSNDRCIASRCETEFSQGYVFTSRPIQLGEKIVVQVLATEPMYLGDLALGLTSCDPSHLSPHDLPDDSHLLLDRPEYWVVNKDVAGGAQRGDELAFCITTSGEVQMSKNGGPSLTLMHIDHSQTLWAFLDIYGSTQKIRILGSIPHPSQSCSPPSRALQQIPLNSVPQPPERCRPPVTVATAPGVGGGTVLVVNLPPPAGTTSPPVYPGNHNQSHLSYSPTYVEPVNLTTTEGIREWAENSITASQHSDCSVCYERTVDSVLYTCGHMCMCYECSLQQWKGKGGGHCPLCRAVIRDVIRIFRS